MRSALERARGETAWTAAIVAMQPSPTLVAGGTWSAPAIGPAVGDGSLPFSVSPGEKGVAAGCGHQKWPLAVHHADALASSHVVQSDAAWSSWQVAHVCRKRQGLPATSRLHLPDLNLRE